MQLYGTYTECARNSQIVWERASLTPNRYIDTSIHRYIQIVPIAWVTYIRSEPQLAAIQIAKPSVFLCFLFCSFGAMVTSNY